MPDGNGASRLDRIEKQIERLGDVVSGLVEHAGLSNQRFDTLEGIVRENNERIASLVSASWLTGSRQRIYGRPAKYYRL